MKTFNSFFMEKEPDACMAEQVSGKIGVLPCGAIEGGDQLPGDQVSQSNTIIFIRPL